jgi:hypothetical protein
LYSHNDRKVRETFLKLIEHVIVKIKTSQEFLDILKELLKHKVNIANSQSPFYELQEKSLNSLNTKFIISKISTLLSKDFKIFSAILNLLELVKIDKTYFSLLTNLGNDIMASEIELKNEKLHQVHRFIFSSSLKEYSAELSAKLFAFLDYSLSLEDHISVYPPAEFFNGSAQKYSLDFLQYAAKESSKSDNVTKFKRISSSLKKIVFSGQKLLEFFRSARKDLERSSYSRLLETFIDKPMDSIENNISLVSGMFSDLSSSSLLFEDKNEVELIILLSFINSLNNSEF